MRIPSLPHTSLHSSPTRMANPKSSAQIHVLESGVFLDRNLVLFQHIGFLATQTRFYVCDSHGFQLVLSSRVAGGCEGDEMKLG